MHVPSGETRASTPCWSCGHVLDPDDRYCRRCGQGQGRFLAWYYRPLAIALLTLTALGPFALPLVWRTPRLSPGGKWIASLAIVTLSVYVMLELVLVVEQVGTLLGHP